MHDIEELYQDIILRHGRQPSHEGVPEGRTHEAEGFNPVCGDRVAIYVRETEGTLVKVGFAGEGCMISRASASLLSGFMEGRGSEDAEIRAREMIALLAARDEPETSPFDWGDLASLVAIRRFPPRVKCATLPWQTLVAALQKGPLPVG